MSRAFVKEDDATGGAAVLPDRPVSAHANLVTPRGLRLIEAELARHRRDLAEAEARQDPEAAARASRELRYWAARHATAEPVAPPSPPDRVRFGTDVTLERADGSRTVYAIVGEDEADPGAGRIAWVAPVARALLGAQVGDVRRLPTGEVEVVAIDAAACAEAEAARDGAAAEEAAPERGRRRGGKQP